MKSGFSLYSIESNLGKQFYWRIVARNGRIVADSSEGYKTEAKAKQGFKSAMKAGQKALEKLSAAAQ